MKKIYISLFAMLLSAYAMAQNFTPGNLVVYRAGDGSAAVGTTGTAVFLDEYNFTTGALVQSLPMPTAVSGANKRLVCVGNSTTEGFLTLSADKQYIVAPGYDAATATASLGSSTSATVARVIARVDATKVINTTTALTNAFSGASYRGVCSSNGTDFWMAGANTGTLYASLGGTTATTISSSPTNMRNAYIFDNQLYVSTGGATGSRAQKVGTGLPTTTGQINSSLTGVPTTGSVNGFFFADMNTAVAGLDVLYIANDGVGTGLQKYITTDGINWVAKGNVSTSLIRGLTGVVVGTDVQLYATTTTNTIVKYTDVAANTSDIAGGVFTAVATGAVNTLIKGICFAPELPTSPTLSATPSSFSGIVTVSGIASATQIFNLSGINLTGAPGTISITPSTGLEILDPATSLWTSSPINVSYTAATLASSPLSVRIAASAAGGAFTGTVICAGGGGTTTVNVTGAVTQNFYTKPTGDLSVLATWGTTTADGTGTMPLDFTSPYQIFTVKNRTNAIPAAHWEVSGTGSKLIIGDGLNPTTVTTTLMDTIKPTTLVDIAALSTLEIGNRVAPTFGTLATGSTVNYNYDPALPFTTADTVKINVANYHHLILKKGLKYFKSGITGIAGDLTFDDTKFSNGAASPFTTLSLKGNLNMINGALMDDSTTGQANRLTLSMAGTTPQLISTSGNELSIFRLIRDTTVLTNSDITLAANSKITVGNNTSGGLSLLQRVGTTPTTTRLIMNNNAQLAVVKAGVILTDATKVGKIFSNNSKIILNKSLIATTNPGTLLFETGSTLSDLTVNIATATKDSILINGTVEIGTNLNLTKGVIVTTPSTTALILNAAATTTGGSATSYVDGKLRKTNPVTTSFLFPVGQAKQYAPIEMSGLTAADDFTVQYFKQAYTTLAVSAATTTVIPTYAISNKEYWNIDRIGTGTPNIKFYYNTNSIALPTQAKIAHFNGVDWDDIDRDSNGADVNGNFISKNMVSTFSPFTFGGLPSALPIKLDNFIVLKNDKTVKIQFATIEEINTNYFEIERSSDAKKWNLLSTIKASGNSSNTITYNETDYNPTTGVNYYRIKTVDKDGKISYSAIKSVLFSINFDVVLSPNPVKNIMQVLLSKKENESALITIVNAMGAKMFEQTTTKPTLYINASSFTKGLYHVRVVSEANTITKTIVIQ